MPYNRRMKLICIMVESIDGKTTKWGNQHVWQWTSKEDQTHFSKTIEQANLIIMGRKTFEAAKSTMKHVPSKLRVVITSEPEKFAQEQMPGQLEFTNEDPEILIKRLEQQGFTEALLVGGGNINSLFFQKRLVNEFWITIEPKLFGKGNSLVAESELDINFELLSVEKLNSQGTLLIKYTVKN